MQILFLLKANEDSVMCDKVMYQRAVGSLLYLSTRTRPDISFAVGRVSTRPTRHHISTRHLLLRVDIALLRLLSIGLQLIRESFGIFKVRNHLVCYLKVIVFQTVTVILMLIGEETETIENLHQDFVFMLENL